MNKIVIFILLLLFICGCTQEKNEVVIYTSLDQIFSEPILQAFQRETGIKVKAIYDVEATKTTGLVNRLIAEKNNPQADVFWNSEVARTIVLKQKGVLSPYFSPSALDIPAGFKDLDGYWTGFAARARVLIYNTDLVAEEEIPQSIFELTKPRWQGQVALSYPLFGTTATHAVSLFVRLGDEKARQYFQDLNKNDVVIVDGNATSRDRVAQGELKIGFTDTDDAYVAILDGKPVNMIYPDREGIGTLFIPNTVCLIKNCPNPKEAKMLIDFLLSKEVESKLAYSSSMQIPLRSDVKKPKHVPSFDKLTTMDIDYEQVAQRMKDTEEFLKELFVR